MTESSNVLSVGFLLQEYRIDSVLGAGGFGITYKAWDTHLDTWVAIKEYFPAEWCYRSSTGVSVLSNTYSVREGGEEQVFDYEWGLNRFLDEARVLARVQSSHVVRIKRYFRANGSAYIVMDYEEGEPLNRCLRREKTLSETQIRQILQDVLPALQTIHDQGFLHRDIKPSNLYTRTRDNAVMLIDFGAAREALGRASRSITGLVTPGYSPPEQYAIRSDRYGSWTDIYALGAVLYRCVTGKPPLEAADRLLDDRLVSAREAGAGRYSETLLTVIDKALAVRPEERYQSARDMQWDLGADDRTVRKGSDGDNTTRPLSSRAADIATQVVPSPLSPNPKRWPWWLGLPLAVALVATMWLLRGEERSSEDPVSASPTTATAAPPSVPVVETPEVNTDASPAVEDKLSPDDAPDIATQTGQSTSKDVFVEAHIDMAMVWIPEGCFVMGSPSDEPGRHTDEEQQRRCVDGFWLGSHEVTNAQFRRFRESHDSGAYQGQSLNGDQQPVVEVSWHDAMDFARWLSEQTGQHYRLPTEAEWEYAARAGSTTARFWGDAAAAACDYANIHDLRSREINTEFAEFNWDDFHDCDDGAAVTSTVGRYQANDWGLYDMLGNVWEWTCSNALGNTVDTGSTCATDGEFRILRGSSWVGTPDTTRSAQRIRYDPSEVLDTIGFRLLREG